MIPSIKNKKIFITGGAGFIGSTLVGRLIDDNQITIYDDFRRDALSGKSFAKHPNLRTVQGDVLDLSSLESAVNGTEIVVHCAAIAGIDTIASMRPSTKSSMKHQARIWLPSPWIWISSFFNARRMNVRRAPSPT